MADLSFSLSESESDATIDETKAEVLISKFRKERRHFRRPVFRICRLRTTFEGLDQKEQIEDENYRDQGALDLSKSDQYPRRNEAANLD